MHAKRPVLNCRLWRFCPHCAWRREMDMQARFLESFRDGVWNFLTASFTGNLPLLSTYLNRHHTVLTHADLITYWDAIRFAVNQLVNEGTFRGAVLVEEIHLETLHPMALVTPHSHIIILTDAPLDQASLDRFTSLLLQFRGQVWSLGNTDADDRQWHDHHRKVARWEAGRLKTKPRNPTMVMVTDPRLKVELPISLDLQPLATEREFSDRLGYIAKPVGLQRAYVKTRSMLIQEKNWNGLELLAQNTDEFILSFDHLLRRRRSPAYFGACDARRKTRYIGQPGQLLEDEGHRNAIKAALKRLPKHGEPEAI